MTISTNAIFIFKDGHKEIHPIMFDELELPPIWYLPTNSSIDYDFSCIPLKPFYNHIFEKREFVLREYRNYWYRYVEV